MAETNDCTKGMGVTKNNCFGYMTWENGYREGKTYSSKEESYKDFKELWIRAYGGFPTIEMAKKWTGNHNSNTWYNNVSYYYNK